MAGPTRSQGTEALGKALGPGNALAVPALPRLVAVLQAPTFRLVLLLGLGIGAVVISATVVFAMTSMTAEMRRYEVAVRVALGARLRHVVALFVKSESSVALLGLAVGVPMAVWLGRVLQAFVVEATATSYETYVIAGALMLMTVLAAVSQSILRFHRRVARSIQVELAGVDRR